MAGGSSRAANAPRKEKASVKAVMLLHSVAPGESVLRPSTSSFKRSSGGPKISIRMSNRGSDVSESISLVEVLLDTEDKRKSLGDYRVARSLLKSLRKRVKQLESELTKTEARVLEERKVGKARAEATRIEAVEVFRASKEFHNIKANFASLSYLQGDIDLKEKVRRIFPDLNLNLLESDDEEAEEAEGRKIQIEDVFSPAHNDLAIEDAALVPPPAIIILPDQVEVGKSGALDGT
ncbi:hypothetical protein COCNU_06G000430 [Cocos nucifera]|uniref:Uncharacterized protein n=1 Tax=Cocos nucifera TaxID=13894 RepID=A0A8K0I9R5_COCNU|nr:hypothetical protein COCNU_06G000430 [Cocos nucifera]